jgi:hypothetical protein
MTNKMNPILKANWCKALRSGWYVQGRSQFQRDGALCCLAVGYKVAKPDADIGWATTGDGVEALGLTDDQGDVFIEMNDHLGKTFSEIADYIESPESGL